MRKISFFFVFVALYIMSASFGVSFANAANPGEGLQFCFIEDKEGTTDYPRLNFSQKPDTENPATGEVCFDKWYEANPTGAGTPDANTYLNNWLSAKQGAIAFVRVTSDIKFAGRSSIGCAVGNNAFEGKMITLYSFQTLYSQINPQTNEPYVISGLCHFGNVQIVAFIEKFSGTMYNMNFDDAYLNASATNSSAGIIAEGVTGLDGSRVFNGYIHDVKVTNSEFQGTNVGAIVGKGNTDISSAELHNVKIVGNSNTNSYVGGIIGDNTVRCLHADQGNVHPCSNAKNNGKSAGPFVLENVDIFGSIVTGQQSYVGGIAGSITLNVKQEYHDISIKGLRMNGSTYAGGLFGQVFYDGSDDETVNPSLEHKLSIHDVSIEHGSFKTLDGVENGFIRASLRAGGLIGYCDVGNNANNTEGADVEIYNVDNKIEVRIDDANNISAGGIIGNLMNTSNETTNLSIYNTNTEGDIIGGSDTYKMGYLVGEMVTSKINLKQITDNTHYGANDYVAAKGIGSIDPANWLNPPAPINAVETGLVVKRNFRNEIKGTSAQTSLVADGSLEKNSDGYYIQATTTTDKYANGVVSTRDLNQYQNNTTGSSGEYLFCVKIPTNKDSLYLRQIKNGETEPADYTCYEEWEQNDQNLTNDAYSRIQTWLNSRDNEETAHVVVESDLHFAGRNIDGTCKAGWNDFNGGMLTFTLSNTSSYTKGVYTIQGAGDKTPVISGLCFITASGESVGFFSRFDGDMSNLAFDDAYFESADTKSGAGVIASGFGSASIKVTNSEFHGNAAGAVYGRGGGALTNVVVEKVKVYGSKYAGGLIGYWDNTFRQNVQIELAKVEADVTVSGTSPAYAGALVGYLGNMGSSDYSIKIANTYSIGDVAAVGNFTGVAGTGAMLGYLIGAFNQHDNFVFDIHDNYHSGTNDISAKKGIGSFVDENDIDEWHDPSTSETSAIKNGVIKRNFRNAIENYDGIGAVIKATSLPRDGDFVYSFDRPIMYSVHEYANGAIALNEMKSLSFAALLNHDDAAWTLVDGENNGLPVFADANSVDHKPIYQVAFNKKSFEENASETKKTELQNAVNKGKTGGGIDAEEVDDFCGTGCKGLIVFTNNKGMLEEAGFFNSLLLTGDSWVGSPELSATQVYTDGNTIYEFDKVEYELVFNDNSAGEAFFGDSWESYITEKTFDENAVDVDKNWNVKLGYDAESANKKFPTALYRNDRCMSGYTFDKDDDSHGVYTELSDAFMETYKTLGKTSPTTLYAYWTSCTPTTVELNIVDTDKGSYTFSRKFALGNDKYTQERNYVASADKFIVPSDKGDISFTGVLFTPKSGANVMLDAGAGISYRNKNETEWKSLTSGNLTVTNDLEAVKLTLLKKSYEFTYDMNAPTDVTVFVSPTEKKKESYTLANLTDSKNLQSLDVLARTDACLVGWALDKAGVNVIDVIDLEALRKLDALEKSGKSTEMLYAVWKSKGNGCTPKTFNIATGMKAEQGSFKVSYTYENKTYAFDVGENGVEIPVLEGIEIGVKFTGSAFYTFGNVVTGSDTNGKKVFEVENGNAFTVAATQPSVKLSVVANLNEVHLVFDIPSDNSMYYGEDWRKDGDYTSGDKATFPTMVYDSDRCLAGWSIQSESGSTWTVLNEKMLESLYKTYPALSTSTDVNLYAQWTDNVDECAGNITRATAEVEHGEIQLVEKTDKANIVHEFNKDGYMMLPAEIESKNWTLKTNPDSSYTLDSLVVIRDGKVITVLHEGDNLPENMKNVVLKTYFGKENKTKVKIVNKDFAQSGNTIRVDIKASDFEVTRGVSAKLQLIDVAKDSVVKNMLLSDSAAMGFSDEIVLHVLQPGEYKARIVIGDDKESDEYSWEFTVDSKLAELHAERWQMLSLSAVDTSLITWDEGSFFWWDEKHVGEYWQYRAFNRGDKIDGSRGVWVSSMHEGTLVMRSDYEDDGKDIVWELDSVITGWNLVANPHGWYVDLYSLNESARKNVDEKSEVSFYHYDSETGGYKETRCLAPYEAVWAKVSKNTTWKVSAEPVYDLDCQLKPSDSRISGDKALAKSLAGNRWTLQAVLADKNGKRDSWNILGASEHPFVADEPPASMGDHVNLSIVENKRSLAKSFKTASDEMEWTLELSASNARDGYLTIEGVENVESLGYSVYVTIDGETTEMHEGKSLQVSLKSSSKKATVRVARSAGIVAKNVLKGLRSVQVGNQLQVSFDASENLVGERSNVELLDVKGRVIATVSAKALSGTNAMTMMLPKLGVYILRVRVGSQQLAQRIFVK